MEDVDVTTVEQAQITKACSICYGLDKLPSDVRKAGGVARTAILEL